jgi:hypothetical protein
MSQLYYMICETLTLCYPTAYMHIQYIGIIVLLEAVYNYIRIGSVFGVFF